MTNRINTKKEIIRAVELVHLDGRWLYARIQRGIRSFVLRFAWAWPLAEFVRVFIESEYQIIRLDLLVISTLVATILDKRRESRNDKKDKDAADTETTPGN